MTKKTPAAPPLSRTAPAWRDCTTYRRDQTDCKPTSFRMSLDRFELAITCDHIHHPGKWVMHFADILREHELEVETLAEAQEKALKIARVVLGRALRDAEAALAPRPA